MRCGSDGGIFVLSAQSCQLLERETRDWESGLSGACPDWIGDDGITCSLDVHKVP
jgi:hypothetical protein